MKKEKNYLYDILKVIYTFLLKLLFKPTIYGKENIPKEGPIIFVGNHINALDPVMVMSSTDRIVHYMAKQEVFNGFHGWIFKKIGLIPVNRSKANPLAVIEAEKILNSGGAIGIFPEGTRNRTKNDLLPFKKGAVIIAQRTNSKIVPFAIRGKYKLFRKNVVLEFGKPIEILSEDKNEANDELKKEVLELLRK